MVGLEGHCCGLAGQVNSTDERLLPQRVENKKRSSKKKLENATIKKTRLLVEGKISNIGEVTSTSQPSMRHSKKG